MDQDSGAVGFGEEEDKENEGGVAHDGGEVLRPAPAEIRVCDEAANL